MAYARHQSFYLRDRWISKGLTSVSKNPRFFYEDDAAEQIGLGKNMLQSLRFWLNAMNLIKEEKVNQKTVHTLSFFGSWVLDNDRWLLDNTTISLLHYYLVKNDKDLATVFQWFFNESNISSIIREELLVNFEAWVRNREAKQVSVKSLKKDIDCLVQLYTKAPDEADPESVTFSPLHKIGLIEEKVNFDSRLLLKRMTPKPDQIGSEALFYTLNDYAYQNDRELISVDEIVSEPGLWGKVYHLNRDDVFYVLNKMVNEGFYKIEYVRTNKLDNVKLIPVKPEELLKTLIVREGGVY